MNTSTHTSRLTFYLFILALVVLDSVLLRSPNILGKIGLIIYKYHYLRTFPKALVTVTGVVGLSIALAEIVRWLVKREAMKRITGKAILLLFSLAAAGMLIKTILDFTTWTYSHTGMRFRCGAYLLPAILLLVFIYNLFSLPPPHVPFPESPAMDEKPTPQN